MSDEALICGHETGDYYYGGEFTCELRPVRKSGLCKVSGGRMTEDLLNELTEKLIAAYRARLEAQKAYYGRENEVDDELEQAVVDTYEAFRRAEFLHGPALILYATHPDLNSDYMEFASRIAVKEGWPL